MTHFWRMLIRHFVVLLRKRKYKHCTGTCVENDDLHETSSFIGVVFVPEYLLLSVKIVKHLSYAYIHIKQNLANTNCTSKLFLFIEWSHTSYTETEIVLSRST